MKDFSFSLPVNIIFGSGRINELAQHISEDIQRILIVSEKNVAEKSLALTAVKDQLEGKDLWIFLDVEENPSFETVEAGGVLARQNDCQLIIGVGGGSPMDAAKGIAMLATNKESLKNLIEMPDLPTDPLPVICIPTTSGTGSEVTPYAVFTDRSGKNKCGYGHDKIFPQLALLDPELSFSMPKQVTINTGLDALTHSIEAFLSTESFAMNDMIALESIRKVIDHLPGAAKNNHTDMEAMAYASMLGGIAITHGGTILLHIMGYPLTVYQEIPHGKANAILLPSVIDYLRLHSTVKDKIAILDQMFSAAGGIKEFVNKLGVSTKLSDYGIQESDFDHYVKKVIVKGDLKITPAKIEEQDIYKIYQAAL